MIKIKDEFDNIEEKKVCVASMKDIENNLTKEKCLYSLNMKDYKDYKVVCPEGYELKNIRDISKFDGKSKRLANFANENGKYRYYSSGQKILKCDVADFKNELSIIIGHSGDGCIFIDDTFSTLITNHVLQTDNKYKTLYIYDYLNYFWNKFYEKCYKGSTVKNTSNDEIEKFEIPFPKNMDKHKKQLDNLYRIHQEIMTGTEQIPQSEQEICELIKKATDEGKKGVDYEEYKLGDVCEVKAGAYLKSYNKGIYPIVGGGNISNYIDTYSNENDWVIHKDGISNKIISYINGKFFVNHHGWTITTKKNINKNYLGYSIINMTTLILERSTASNQKGINQDNFYNFNIKVLTENKMKKLKLQEKFDGVDKLKENLENNKQLYQEKMKEFFKDFEEKDDSNKSCDSEEEKVEVKPKKKVKQIKKVESSSESESDNNSDNCCLLYL